MANYLGVLVKDLRTKKGYSQERLAREACMSTSHVCKIESYDIPVVGRDSLKKMAKVLEVNEDTLLILAGKMPEVVRARCRESIEYVHAIKWLAGLTDGEIEELRMIWLAK